jgi:hypothetical protein
MSTVQPPLPNVDCWTAMQIRLIAFPVDAQGALHQEWWHDLTGAQGESTRKLTERVDSGVVDGRNFSLFIDPLRITWSADPPLPSNEMPATPALLGSITAECDWFTHLMDTWLAQCPAIRRLAFFGRFFQRTPTRDDSYHLLERYLPGIRVDVTGTDFLYRINRKRPAATPIAGLQLNRICTWCGAKLSVGAFVQALGNPRSTQNFAFGDTFGSIIDVDTNTAAEFDGVLPHDTLIPLFHELKDIAVDAVARGDAP